MEHPSSYHLGFTAASLRPELGRIIAEVYLTCGDWEQTKKTVVFENALQARSSTSGSRLEREIRPRLQLLTRSQVEILAGAPADGRRSIAWLSVLKRVELIYTFSADVLRTKLETHDAILRPSDYEGFIATQSIVHSELAALKPSTLDKLKRTLMAMLREAGILSKNLKDPALTRPFVPPDVLQAILDDDRGWLAGFLVPDDEIATL